MVKWTAINSLLFQILGEGYDVRSLNENSTSVIFENLHKDEIRGNFDNVITIFFYMLSTAGYFAYLFLQKDYL